MPGASRPESARCARHWRPTSYHAASRGHPLTLRSAQQLVAGVDRVIEIAAARDLIDRTGAEHFEIRFRIDVRHRGTRARLDEHARQRLSRLLEVPEFRTVYELRVKLQAIWEQRTGSMDELAKALRQWCADAEATGSPLLADFVRELRCYTLPRAAVACG